MDEKQINNNQEGTDDNASISENTTNNTDVNAESSSAPMVNNESTTTGSGKKFKILAVEDDNFLRDLLSRKLGKENSEFLTAIDGEEALKILETEIPSIILLDLVLPGIDGFEVLEKIRQNPRTKDIPVVILSNLGQDSDVEKAKELGANDFLIKANFSIDEVIEKIKTLV